jgi:hypothetical protein
LVIPQHVRVWLNSSSILFSPSVTDVRDDVFWLHVSSGRHRGRLWQRNALQRFPGNSTFIKLCDLRTHFIRSMCETYSLEVEIQLCFTTFWCTYVYALAAKRKKLPIRKKNYYTLIIIPVFDTKCLQKRAFKILKLQGFLRKQEPTFWKMINN